jgi:hypothetical protein
VLKTAVLSCFLALRSRTCPQYGHGFKGAGCSNPFSLSILGGFSAFIMDVRDLLFPSQLHQTAVQEWDPLFLGIFMAYAHFTIDPL